MTGVDTVLTCPKGTSVNAAAKRPRRDVVSHLMRIILAADKVETDWNSNVKPNPRPMRG